MLHPPLLDAPARLLLRQADLSLELAQTRRRPVEMSLALCALGRAYLLLPSLASAESCFELALHWGRLAASRDLEADLLGELCEVAARQAVAADARHPGQGQAARERAREHAEAAGRLASKVADPAWEVKLLLRLSDGLDRCGERDEALQLQTRAMRLLSGAAAGGAAEASMLPGLGRLADA
jgi:hypothetical protein